MGPLKANKSVKCCWENSASEETSSNSPLLAVQNTSPFPSHVLSTDGNPGQVTRRAVCAEGSRETLLRLG